MLKWAGRLCSNSERSIHEYLGTVDELKSTRLRKLALEWFVERTDVGTAPLKRAAAMA